MEGDHAVRPGDQGAAEARGTEEQLRVEVMGMGVGVQNATHKGRWRSSLKWECKVGEEWECRSS